MQKTSTDFFLAANSGKGFYSLFDELYAPREGWRAYIIKGGPGTGKSGIMKNVSDYAVKHGCYCENIFCSSDPDSLDGVIIPELKFCIADGTAPHLIEPKYPGVSEKIINLGEYWDESKLKSDSEHIITLTDCNKALHHQSSGYLKAAAAVQLENIKIISSAVKKDKIENFVIRYINRNFRCTDSYGNEKKRFINAVTPKGRITFFNCAQTMCDAVISVNDEYSVVSSMFMQSIKQYALANGIDVITCLNPIDPDGNPMHVIFPDERIGFFTSNRYHNFKVFASKNINAKRFVDMEKFNIRKNRIIFNQKTYDSFVDEAVSVLVKAKNVHDNLEKYYVKAMDFDKVNKISERIIQEIF